MAQDAWELLQELEIRRPWLLGLSNGSSISLELLAGHPGAFAGAVLTSSMPCIDFTTRLRILHWLQCLDLGGPLMQFDAAAPYLWGDRFLEQRHGVLRAYHQVIASGQGHGALEPSQSVDRFRGARLQMEGILHWDIRSRLGLIQDPAAAPLRGGGSAHPSLEVPGDGPGDPAQPVRDGARHRPRPARGGSQEIHILCIGVY